MKKIILAIAAMAMVFASCSTDNESDAEYENITLNITVAGLWSEESATKAPVKTGWENGDQISIWYDANQGDTPDLVIVYDGRKWKGPGSIKAPGNAAGYVKCLYDGDVKVASKVSYTYTVVGSAPIFSFDIAGWAFLTEMMVLVEGVTYDPGKTYTLACDRLAPCTGYTVNADNIVAQMGAVGTAVTGIENADGIAYVFGTSDSYGAGADYKYTFSDGRTNRVYTDSDKTLTRNASIIISLKMAYDGFVEQHDWVQLWENGPKFATTNLGAASVTATGDTYAWTATGASDAAATEWGGCWNVPTDGQMNELYLAATGTGSSKISCKYTAYEGTDVYGFLFTGKGDYSGKSLFLPAPGGDAGNGGVFYWSGTASGSYGRILCLSYYGYWNSEWYLYDTNNKSLVRPVWNNVPVTAITLNKTETSIAAGQTETLSVSSIAPSNATDQTVSWSSSDTGVASVDVSTGVVTGIAPGTASITATANDGSGVAATCTVTVPAATGFAPVLASAGMASHIVGWVQLWENGPKWAGFNVGATISDYAGANSYTTANIGGLYRWCGTNNMRDHTSASDDHHADDYSESDDTARKIWGTNWQMPTQDQLEALGAGVSISGTVGGGTSFTGTHTIWTWCDGFSTQYASGCTLKGWKISGLSGSAYAGNSIFLPVTSLFNFNYNRIDFTGLRGYYWSSTKNGSGSAWGLLFYITDQFVYNDYREYGFGVRAVLAE